MGHIDIIKETGVAAVIRGATVDNIVAIGEALSKGGVKVLEITVETPGACAAIEKASLEFDDVLVGAGTVLDPETARIAIMSGAKFIFSPTINVKTIEMAKRYGVVSIPGALTPTEILSAYENGGDLVKVFPANVFGPSYIKDIHGPLPQIPLITTGGISVNNVGEYIKAGATGVGVGSSLVNTKKELTEDYLNEITETASTFIKAVQEAREVT
ncbi:bifunctional 4-hydroxy-2-oxoglutarate aldolase/2-dehydro-3-deoxy-phosphogluconate aldolase [Metabacillus litoralis]|uniref:bifunctional 4-hydroxy-2-oxoglutarate aldolase/2-dehydro-3-deoxy-phosphogluconate aldolase n=1 Tax=Metabacillus litoralis TaxID=152268 RepID=UPI001CFED354|nr:bifunctional 4-hydroxy-2-oxoglutarate aldolase/2-dehydro-3-deoxy-phosphogluconate aldolase [Metabacillus litoralis]